jgi:hypothetical protein
MLALRGFEVLAVDVAPQLAQILEAAELGQVIVLQAALGRRFHPVPPEVVEKRRPPSRAL